MADYVIMTDSCCDLPAELAEELALEVLPLRLKRGWQWALVSGGYGLAFGTLCSLTYLPVGGIRMAFAWIVSGLPFDLIHGAGNFILMLALYYPLHRALESLARRRHSGT